jgi:hypothetical protein
MFLFIWSGASASALRFKRAFAAEHLDNHAWCELFPLHQL